MPGEARSALRRVVVDAADPRRLGHWWAQALQWRVVPQRGDELEVAPAPGQPGVPLVFVPVAEPRRGPARLHLDLDSDSPAAQRETVAALLDAGARRADVGQGEVPWVVLADPEGNEFCVLEPRPRYEGTGAVAAVVVRSLAPQRLARFWALATGWDVRRAAPEFASLRAGDAGPYLEFVRTRTPHTGENRWRPDVVPHAAAPEHGVAQPGGTAHRVDAQHAVVTSLLAAGARRVDARRPDVGRGQPPWVVLADPEGNEFRVLPQPRA